MILATFTFSSNEELKKETFEMSLVNENDDILLVDNPNSHYRNQRIFVGNYDDKDFENEGIQQALQKVTGTLIDIQLGDTNGRYRIPNTIALYLKLNKTITDGQKFSLVGSPYYDCEIMHDHPPHDVPTFNYWYLYCPGKGGSYTLTANDKGHFAGYWSN